MNRLVPKVVFPLFRSHVMMTLSSFAGGLGSIGIRTLGNSTSQTGFSLKGSIRNQGMNDVTKKGKSPLSKITAGQSMEALQDIKELGNELSDTPRGYPPKEAKVRNLSPMKPKEELVEKDEDWVPPGSWVNPPRNPPSSSSKVPA